MVELFSGESVIKGSYPVYFHVKDQLHCPKPYNLESINFERRFTSPHMSCVRCHMSGVRCQVSNVTCHMSRVTCHVSQFFMLKLKLVSGGCVVNGAYPVYFPIKDQLYYLLFVSSWHKEIVTGTLKILFRLGLKHAIKITKLDVVDPVDNRPSTD